MDHVTSTSSSIGARARYWEPYAAMVLDKDSLNEGVDRLLNDDAVGLVVLINRYDGVDLPGDACHVLVIDGLPEPVRGLDRLDQAQLVESTALIARQVQRLEQGMGRATRSNEDHCVVLLLGARLGERLYSPAARANLSPATRTQLELSERVAEELEGTELSDLLEVIYQCFERDEDWVRVSRAVLAPLRYSPVVVSDLAVASRTAFDLAAAHEFRSAVSTLQTAVDAASGSLKGYLLQQMAAYLHHVDPAAAQQTQLAANRSNRNVLRPMNGVAYERLTAPAGDQAAAACQWLQTRYATSTELLLGVNAMLGDLDWGPRTAAFEGAWADLAWHFGLAGQEPERDTGRGPDGLWALGNGEFIVCEAKSEAKPNHPVYKRDAEQLSNSMDWFRENYPATVATPLMVHPQAGFDSRAGIPTGCRVVTTNKLSDLRAAVFRFSAELADTDCFRDPSRVRALLQVHGFTAVSFLSRYSDGARRQR